jgi:hypothetical protein
VWRDTEPVNLTSLPESIALSRDRLEVSFRSLEELAEAMYSIARLLDDQGEDFALAYVPQPESKIDDTGDVRELFTELEIMETLARAAQRPESLPSPDPSCPS